MNSTSTSRSPCFYAAITAALGRHEPFALGVITAIRGSSPQKMGAKALFFADGTIVGTMGGGCLEAEIQDRARRSLASGKPAMFDLVLDHDFGWDDGLICGGRVEGLIVPRAEAVAELWRDLAHRDQPRVWGIKPDYSLVRADHESAESEWLYRESVLPRVSLWIAGAGHVAQAVAPLALNLDFEVTVFDDRAALANSNYFPEPTQFRTGPWEQQLADPMPSGPVFGLIVTRGHQHDALALSHWINRPFAFLGMIGSRRKRRLIFDGLIAGGIADETKLAAVSCPVGLPIGGSSVQEIAISIAAQLVSERAAWTEKLVARP